MTMDPTLVRIECLRLAIVKAGPNMDVLAVARDYSEFVRGHETQTNKVGVGVGWKVPDKIDADEPILARPIDDLDLPPGVLKKMKRPSYLNVENKLIRTIGDLVVLQTFYLGARPYFGDESLRKIKDALRDVGLRLDMTITPAAPKVSAMSPFFTIGPLGKALPAERSAGTPVDTTAEPTG